MNHSTKPLALLIWVCLFGTLSISRSSGASTQDARQSRLNWNLETTVDAYKKVGKTNSKWDEPAIRALTEYARNSSKVTSPEEPWEEIIRTNCDAAIKAGCNDPMVRYLHVRFSLTKTSKSQALAGAYYEVAVDMQKSGYHAIRKFYASHRAVNQASLAYGYTNSLTMPTVKEIAPILDQDLLAVVNNSTTPVEEVYAACDERFRILKWHTEEYIRAYSNIESPLFANWPDESIILRFKGEAYIDMAWNARGEGYANTVTPEGLKIFYDNIAIAEIALNQAWKLNPKDPRIADGMMQVELAQGQGRSRMELWFDRAMKLDPNDYFACNRKSLYLEPKWHGSVQDVLNFGRECLQNTNWGGQVPLVLVYVHNAICLQYINKSEQTNYWDRPEVWHDVKTAYDRYFGLNPSETNIYSSFISIAVNKMSADCDCDWTELWFQRAMKINPNDYIACLKKLQILAKNNRSNQDLLNFGRECLQNSNWGGRVPLILVEAHAEVSRRLTSEREQANYWRQSQVWRDLKSAYDRFFELNPGDTRSYVNYAKYAYMARQAQAFLDLIHKTDPEDYPSFGDREHLDEMIQSATRMVNRGGRRGRNNAATVSP